MGAAKKKINVGLVGYQFMGKAHSNAYRQVGKFFPEMESEPVLKGALRPRRGEGGFGRGKIRLRRL